MFSNPRKRRARRRYKNALMYANPRRKSRRRYRNVPAVLVANPRRRRRYRNAGMGDTLRRSMSIVLTTALPATIGGFALGFIDGKFLSSRSMVARTVGKILTALGIGVVGARFLGTTGTAVAVGTVIGSIGHEFGLKAAGGMVVSPASIAAKQDVKKLGEILAEDEQMRLSALEVGGGVVSYDGVPMALAQYAEESYMGDGEGDDY